MIENEKGGGKGERGGGKGEVIERERDETEKEISITP